MEKAEAAVVVRRSPGNPRTQSVQILDPNEVWRMPTVPIRGRVNSLSPPYSSHSQSAAVILAALSIGVLIADRLPPEPSTWGQKAFRAWMFLPAIWLPLLAWVLKVDPRASVPQARCQCSRPLARCKHGCIFEVAPKTRHCRKCDKCVAGFDHHCLWLNTCIGTRNYGRWLLLLAALCCWTLLSSCISAFALFRCHARGRTLAVGHRPAVLVTGSLATLATTWLLLLLGLHVYFSVMGITTLEWATGGNQLRGQLQRCQSLQFSIVSMRCLPMQTLQTPLTPPKRNLVEAAEEAVPEVNTMRRSHWSKLRAAVLSEPSLKTPSSFKWRRRLSLSSVAVEETSESEDVGEDVESLDDLTPARQHSA